MGIPLDPLRAPPPAPLQVPQAHPLRAPPAHPFRFPNGESGADVYDRITLFVDHLVRDMIIGRCARGRLKLGQGERIGGLNGGVPFSPRPLLPGTPGGARPW